MGQSSSQIPEHELEQLSIESGCEFLRKKKQVEIWLFGLEANLLHLIFIHEHEKRKRENEMKHEK